MAVRRRKLTKHDRMVLFALWNSNPHATVADALTELERLLSFQTISGKPDDYRIPIWVLRALVDAITAEEPKKHFGFMHFNEEETEQE